MYTQSYQDFPAEDIKLHTMACTKSINIHYSHATKALFIDMQFFYLKGGSKKKTYTIFSENQFRIRNRGEIQDYSYNFPEKRNCWKKLVKWWQQSNWRFIIFSRSLFFNVLFKCLAKIALGIIELFVVICQFITLRCLWKLEFKFAVLYLF